MMCTYVCVFVWECGSGRFYGICRAKSLPKFVQYCENVRPYSLPNQNMNTEDLN